MKAAVFCGLGSEDLSRKVALEQTWKKEGARQATAREEPSRQGEGPGCDGGVGRGLPGGCGEEGNGEALEPKQHVPIITAEGLEAWSQAVCLTCTLSPGQPAGGEPCRCSDIFPVTVCPRCRK